MGYDVFISHSTKDKEIADAVCAALESSGIRCWMAPRDIKPGASWAASILSGINQSRLMALVFSSHANGSKHVCREVERAVHRDIPVVPLRIEDVMPEGDLEYFLSMSHWMDALTPPLEKHLRVFVQNVQEQLGALGAPAAPAPGPAAAIAQTRGEDRERWARFCNSLPIPTLSDALLPAWVAARDRFQSAGAGNEAEVSTALAHLGEHLGAFEHDLDAKSAALGPALDGPAAARRQQVLLLAVDAVKASPSSAEFPDEARSTLATQFSAWVGANQVLESARSAVRQHQFDTALAKLGELKEPGNDADLLAQADELRDEINKAQRAQSNLRHAIQSTLHDKHWLKAWKKVEALEKQTGQPETELRDQIVNGVVSTAEAKGDSVAWKMAIDLLTQLGRLGDEDSGAASLRETIVAGLLKAAEPMADGDAATRQEALKLLSQLDRLSTENVQAADLRRQIEGKDNYEHAAAKVKEGAFQEAADHFQKASERSYPGSAQRLEIARVLDAADALLKDDQAAVEQLESALKSLAPTPAFNPDELAQAGALREKIQSVLAGKKAQQAQSDLLKAVQAAIDSNQWLDAWNSVDALDEKTGRKDTQWRDQIVNGVVSTAEKRGDSGTWRVAIDLLTLFGRLWGGDKGAASLRERIVADLLKAAGSKADGDAPTRQEGLNLLGQLDRVSKENVKGAELRRQIEGKNFYENAAAKVKEGAFQDAADLYQKASERSCPGTAERVEIARVLTAADALLRNDTAGIERLETALRSLAPTPAFNSDEQVQANRLGEKFQAVLAQKKAQQTQSELRNAVQRAVENKQWTQAWKTIDALDKQTGRKETQLRDQIVSGVVSTAETKGDSGTWTVAIDLLTQFGRLGDGDKGASLREKIVADLLTAATSKADGDATTRQEALSLLGQLDRVSKENVKAAALRRQIEGKGYYDHAAAKVKEGALQEAADHYQKASERSYPGAANRLQIARALAAADALLKNDRAGVDQLETALKSLGPSAGSGQGPTAAFSPDEQAQASGLSAKIQSAVAGKKALQAQSDLLKAVQRAIDNKQWKEAWQNVDALDQQTGRNQTQLRDQIVNGVVSTAEAKGDSGTWKGAIDLLSQFGRLGDASLQDRIVAELLKAAGSKANGDAATRREALDLLSQLDRVSKSDAKAADLRRQIEGKGHYENAAAKVRDGAFQEAADHYQKAGERSYPGSAQRLEIARVLAAADALLTSEKAGIEQLEAALKSLGPTPAFNPDEQAQATALSKRIQPALARKKAQQAQGDLRNAIRAGIDGKRWSEAWSTVDALDQQTGGKETQLRDQIVNGVVSSAEAKEDSGTWKAAIDLLIQFGQLGEGDKSAAALREKIVADLLKAAKAKADGDAAARQEALNLLNQLDRISKGNAKSADLRRQIEGKNYYENAAARIKAGAFQEATDSYQKAGERSYPGAAERLQAARVLASADALVKSGKAGVEQLEPALKGLSSTSAFNSDEQAQARALAAKIQSVLATKYFELADGQERAAPPNFGAAVNHYRKSAGYGRQDASVRQQAAQQLIDIQKLKGPAAIKRIDDIEPSLNDAERSFATSLRTKLAASLEPRPQKIAEPVAAPSAPIQETRPQETAAKTLAPTLEERPRQTAQPVAASLTVAVETQEMARPATGRRVPGWAKFAATAAGLAACAAGVIVYQHQRPSSTIARTDNTLVAGPGVLSATIQPPPPIKVDSASAQQLASANLPPTTGPAARQVATPHDTREQWAKIVDTITPPALSDPLLLPAWNAAHERFRTAAAGNQADVRTKLTQLAGHLNEFDVAIKAQMQQLNPVPAGADAKRRQLLQQAVDAVKASGSGVEFPDDVRSKLQMQFTQWLAAANALEAARVAASQHQDEAAQEKLDVLKEPGTDPDLYQQAEQVRSEIMGGERADLAAAQVLLLKPDTAGASKKVSDVLSRAPHNADARKLQDEIAAAALLEGQKHQQQGDIDAAQASYKIVSDIRPADSATRQHLVDLSDAKKLRTDANAQMNAHKWQSAANDLTDLVAKSDSAGAAKLWPDVENGMLADATAKGDAATWNGAYVLLKDKARVTDALKKRITDGMLGSADQQANTHNDAPAQALLALVDQLSPKDPGAAAIRKKIADAANAKAGQEKINALVKSAGVADQNGDFAAAAAAYSQASKLAPENANVALQAKQEKQNADDAAALDGQARAVLNQGDPTGGLKILDGADARIRKARALTALRTEITNYVANARKNYDNGVDALKRKVFSDAYSDFFYAACGGSPDGMKKLGDMYKNGQGVKSDETMAKTWWQRAADLGNAEAKELVAPKSTPTRRFEPGRS